MPRRRRPQQIALPFRPHGGRRRGAGRKPRGARSRVSHRTRAPLSGREPVLVTMKVLPRAWNLRARSVFARLVPALFAAKERLGCRLAHFSVQRDHLHLLVEATDARSLSRAMQGLAVRIARRVNRMMKRSGNVFADRFHDRVLRTPRQVRNALQYVLGNARKHGVQPRGCRFDPCSSAAAFDGWSIAVAPSPSPLVAAPRSGSSHAAGGEPAARSTRPTAQAPGRALQARVAEHEARRTGDEDEDGGRAARDRSSFPWIVLVPRTSCRVLDPGRGLPRTFRAESSPPSSVGNALLPRPRRCHPCPRFGPS